MPTGFPPINDKSLFYGFIFTNEDKKTRIFLKKGNKKGWFHLKLRKDKFPVVSQYNRMPRNGLGEQYTHFGKNYTITKELRSYTKGKRTYRDWFDIYVAASDGSSLNQSISNVATALYYPTTVKNSSGSYKSNVSNYKPSPSTPSSKPRSMFKLFDDVLPPSAMLSAKVNKTFPKSNISVPKSNTSVNAIPMIKPNAAKPTNAVKPDTAKPTAVKSNTVKPNAAKSTNAVKPNATKPDTAKPTSTKPNVVKSNAVKPTAAKPDIVTSNAAKSNVVKSDIALSNMNKSMPKSLNLDYDDYGQPFSKNLNYEKFN